MKIVDFEAKDCVRIRPLLDSYMNDELLVETNHDVIKHLESCGPCSESLRGKLRVREMLRGAVRRQTLPQQLEKRIQSRIRRPSLGTWSRLAVAVAACLLVTVAGTIGVLRFTQRAHVAQIQRLDGLMRIGLVDHVHCALDLGNAWQHYSFNQMIEELGPEYAGLEKAVSEKVPPGFEVVVAHRCIANNRKFVHLILRKDDQIISISITKKSGETFEGLPSADDVAGVLFYKAAMEGNTVNAFETSDYLVFVVSNLAQERNLSIAEDLAPSVSAFLATAKA